MFERILKMAKETALETQLPAKFKFGKYLYTVYPNGTYTEE